MALENYLLVVWAPSLRTPLSGEKEWPHFLDFEFHTATRINQIVVKSESSAHRKVTAVQIMHAVEQDVFIDIGIKKLDSSPTINIIPPIEARYVRIIVVKAETAENNEKPLGITK